MTKSPRRNAPPSPFPRRFFWRASAPQRDALRESCRIVARWRRAAEAGDFYWLNEPGFVISSDVLGAIWRNWHATYERAWQGMSRRPDYGDIQDAYRAEHTRRYDRGTWEKQKLRSEVAELRGRIETLERQAESA